MAIARLAIVDDLPSEGIEDVTTIDFLPSAASMN
jgi:hypothetical protein